MRKGFILGLAALLCAGLAPEEFCFADTVGNCIDVAMPPERGFESRYFPEHMRLNLSTDIEVVLDRDLKEGLGVSGLEFKGTRYMTKIGCTLFDKFQPYVSLGLADYEMEWNDGPTKVNLHTDRGFVWGLGARFLVWEHQDWGLKLTAQGSYNITDLDIGDVTQFTPITGGKFWIRDMQGALGVSKKIPLLEFEDKFALIPYAGASYLNVKNRIKFFYLTRPFNPGADEIGQSWGGFAGCDFVVHEKVSLNLEGRFVNEQAVSVGFNYMF